LAYPAFVTGTALPPSITQQAGGGVSTLQLFLAITSIGIDASIEPNAGSALKAPTMAATVGSILPVESRHDFFFRMTASETLDPSTFNTQTSAL